MRWERISSFHVGKWLLQLIGCPIVPWANQTLPSAHDNVDEIANHQNSPNLGNNWMDLIEERIDQTQTMTYMHVEICHFSFIILLRYNQAGKKFNNDEMQCFINIILQKDVIMEKKTEISTKAPRLGVNKSMQNQYAEL